MLNAFVIGDWPHSTIVVFHSLGRGSVLETDDIVGEFGGQCPPYFWRQPGVPWQTVGLKKLKEPVGQEPMPMTATPRI
jgi:hypothetical protein